MFSSVLIANRGEIAVRIAKTLRTMGVRSVVTASIPDRRSLAVRTADDWVLLEGYSAAESYLNVDAIIAAAKAKGCEAIHPGYGFLGENAAFAERCAAEGIVFIGPSPAVLRALGDKSAARQLAVANGVPVVPGWDGADDDDTLLREAASIGFPLMVKARGGGGGRGMREVFEAESLPEAIASARREALASFGDPGLLLERLVTHAHHVEVQILADGHGNIVHLGERDCSVQRRHQKLIEESPSPIVDEALRAELTGAALRLMRAAGYVNAGTVEFLVGEAGPHPPAPSYALHGNADFAGEGELDANDGSNATIPPHPPTPSPAAAGEGEIRGQGATAEGPASSLTPLPPSPAAAGEGENAAVANEALVEVSNSSPPLPPGRERGPGGEGVRPFYFLEVNPRLQVEHPVTEMVTGLDLVELQLRVAAGEALPFAQGDVHFEGHAIEFRINAEDPWDDFKPSSGRITRLWGFAGKNQRLDQGYEKSDIVPTQYDSLFAKAIVHASTREEAISGAVPGADYVRGIVTNLGLLDAVEQHRDFREGAAHVGWLEQHLAELLSDGDNIAAFAGAAVALSLPAESAADPDRTHDPTASFRVLRWTGAGTPAIWISDGSRTREVRVRRVQATLAKATIDDVELDVHVVGKPLLTATWTSRGEASEPRLLVGGHRYSVHQDIPDYLNVVGPGGGEFAIVPPPPLPRRAHAASAGATAITAPLSGTITSVRAAEGDAVAVGQLLMTLEAMKMEHRITATEAGTVRSVAVRERDVVREGDVLAEVS